jgi:hypothetical protein
MTMGSKRNDVFVLGDEILAAESTATQDTGSEGAGDGWDEDVQVAGLKATAPVALRTRATSAPRRLAAFGLGAGAAAAIAAALLAEGGGHGATSSPSSTSSVSPPPPNAASVSKVVRPSLPARPHRSHRPQPRIRKAERKPDEHRGKKPEREPIYDEAPVSSPVVISTPAPAPTPVAAAPTPSLPPSATSPPVSDEGGSGGREEFGFER